MEGGWGGMRFVRLEGSRAISGAFRRQNSTLLAASSFTTASRRFASYVTNGLSGVGEGERDLLNEREEKSSAALNSHGNLHLG